MHYRVCPGNGYFRMGPIEKLKLISGLDFAFLQHTKIPTRSSRFLNASSMADVVAKFATRMSLLRKCRLHIPRSLQAP